MEVTNCKIILIENRVINMFLLYKKNAFNIITLLN